VLHGVQHNASGVHAQLNMKSKYRSHDYVYKLCTPDDGFENFPLYARIAPGPGLETPHAGDCDSRCIRWTLAACCMNEVCGIPHPVKTPRPVKIAPSV